MLAVNKERIPMSDNNNFKLWLSPLISNGMVLQRDSNVNICGRGIPGEGLQLNFSNKDYSTIVSEDGSWNILLSGLEPAGPYDMIINHGGEEKTIKDVLVGDVWVLAGQSNMQLPVGRTLDLFENEVRDACYPNIRQFTVPMIYDFHSPVDELSGGSWVPVTPETVYDFSAVGYFFSKKLYDKYEVPIGLLFTAIGGTPAEAWISENSLLSFERFHELISLSKDDSYIENKIKQETDDNFNWYRELYKKDEGLKNKQLPWYSEEYNDKDWNHMELPASFRGTELEPIRGSVWFRKEITLPEHMAAREGKLLLGTIIHADETYINGTKVGNTDYLYPPRRYSIPKGLLKAGKNIITVRTIMTQDIGGFVENMPYYIKVGEEQIDLSGTWKYKVGNIIRPQGPTTFLEYRPIGLYNGMIYPLRNYSIKGVLWYQGESNTGEPYDYEELLETVISDWRRLWQQGDFPFYYVQLANYCPWRIEPEESGYAQVREAQRKLMRLANTGMSVIIDVGMYNDIHPWDKKTVGERLALWALNFVHGEANVCSGPIYKEMTIEDNKVRLDFDYTGSGLIIKGDKLETFEVCGKDGIFYPAQAVIEDDSVIVSCSTIPKPEKVRYGWADNPEGANLYNREDLPASPFMAQIDD